MLLNEFCSGYFRPQSDDEQVRLERFLRLRSQEGEPSRFKILRRLARTRPFTRTIYPPDWRVI
jgi:hypothetical protein